MKGFKESIPDYLKTLNERVQKSRIYQPHQLTGLRLAIILEDLKHKALYMKLAKKYDNQKLVELAKKIAEKKDVKNKGAYFMKAWFVK